MKALPTEKRAEILNCLVEGCSMRSAQRLTGVAKKTVERLLVSAGEACLKYHNEHVKNLKSTLIQLDEIWAFVGAKQANTGIILRDMGVRGDVWTWVAIDAQSKLIASWYTGSRNGGAAYYFLDDLQSRLANRVQISTDGLNAYKGMVPKAFGGNVDFGQMIKIYEHKPSGRYSQPRCIGYTKTVETGNPEVALISTAYAERNNLTIRMRNRRFTRLTNAFSKKVENHEHSLAIHFMHYNFCRIHQTLRITPAMEAGLTDHVWDIAELAALTDSVNRSHSRN